MKAKEKSEIPVISLSLWKSRSVMPRAAQNPAETETTTCPEGLSISGKTQQERACLLRPDGAQHQTGWAQFKKTRREVGVWLWCQLRCPHAILRFLGSIHSIPGSGSDSASWLQLIQNVRGDGSLGFLPLTWKTNTEFPVPEFGFGPAQDHYSCLENDPANGSSCSLKFSLPASSLPPYLSLCFSRKHPHVQYWLDAKSYILRVTDATWEEPTSPGQTLKLYYTGVLEDTQKVKFDLHVHKAF